MKKLVKKNILGIDITTSSSNEILEYIDSILKNSKEKLFIVTPNPEMVVYASSNRQYQTTLNRAEIALCDGVGLFIAGRLLGVGVKERISGVDFMKSLCEKSIKNGLSIGLLGGRDGVAERAAKCLREKYPGLNIVFVAQEWSEEGFARAVKYQVSSIKYKEERIHNTKHIIRNSNIDMLFVAFGVPKQEEWIMKNLEKLPVRLAMGVGGAFDYISGDIIRAPFFIRSVGLEWLFRLIRQPWRWRRQLALITFIGLFIKEYFMYDRK
ncbi:MAG: WecB/TagA/CpsF family glycosyltransferase [Candidatus Levybacteria bacterium]|nr:WecB/TagA/CpsF family glycosyltransferase [Candidatus Levybacteria bacterium]